MAVTWRSPTAKHQVASLFLPPTRLRHSATMFAASGSGGSNGTAAGDKGKGPAVGEEPAAAYELPW
jgi:hypothetical protein